MTYNASLMVDRQVEAGREDKAAFVAPDATLTYGELRRQVNRMGNLLRSLGVGREPRVLLVRADTTASPHAFLGARRIGAVPVPVSALDKADNFRHYVEDSYATVVLTDAQTLLFQSPMLGPTPGAAFAIAVLGLNLLGDGLRDLLDPRLARER